MKKIKPNKLILLPIIALALLLLAVVLYFGTLGVLGVRPREFRRREAG